MRWLLGAVCVLRCLLASGEEQLVNNILAASTTTATPATNHSQSRFLKIEDRQDVLLPPNSYFPYQAAGGTYPPASYGPPTTAIPPGMVQLEFAFEDIVLRCITEEPYEHIVWTKYQCPQQFCFGGDGQHIADGSTVSDSSLYDVHIRGHDGTIISELLIKKPHQEATEGIYQCEAWPHIHGGGGGYSPAYGPYQAPYTPPRSNVFIIGGNALLETCYCNTFGGPLNTKLPGFANKQPTPPIADITRTHNTFALKPRRNSSLSRQDTNSKQLRYNLKYDDNTIYNVDGENVTEEYFRPSKFNPSNFSSPFQQSITKASKVTNSLSNPFFGFTSRSNDKFREIFPKFNVRMGKISESAFNTSVSGKQSDQRDRNQSYVKFEDLKLVKTSNTAKT